jgi:hypothetical protein
MNLQGEAKIADFGISAFVANTVANVSRDPGGGGVLGGCALAFLAVPPRLARLRSP